jgi:hypothetical protein
MSDEILRVIFMLRRCCAKDSRREYSRRISRRDCTQRFVNLRPRRSFGLQPRLYFLLWQNSDLFVQPRASITIRSTSIPSHVRIGFQDVLAPGDILNILE